MVKSVVLYSESSALGVLDEPSLSSGQRMTRNHLTRSHLRRSLKFEDNVHLLHTRVSNLCLPPSFVHASCSVVFVTDVQSTYPVTKTAIVFSRLNDDLVIMLR